MSELIARALERATDTKYLVIGAGAIAQLPQVFADAFGRHPAFVIADVNTYAAAGKAVHDSLAASHVKCIKPFVFDDRALVAEYPHVEALREEIKKHANAIPVAVGSGTVNDLVKLASHECERPYMIAATAASMDGYAAFGASITIKGSKQTFRCPAPRAVVADLEVVAHAPRGMNASGFADLLAKVPAGADWMLADAVGVEPIHAESWDLVQPPLREWLSHAPRIGEGEAQAIRCLMEGLVLSGFAMQSAKSSRPASGADHQFSHLWDMMHHTHAGVAPSHGFKVGIGAQASTALYEALLEMQLHRLHVDACVSAWPALEQQEAAVRALYEIPEIADKAAEETRAKWVTPEQLREQLNALRAAWPKLCSRLQKQLLPLRELRSLLQQVDAPGLPAEIGVSQEMLRKSYLQACYIRRRFTVLDAAVRARVLEPALNRIFSAHGAFPEQAPQTEEEKDPLHVGD